MKVLKMKGRERNSLCWCGSGKKFKKCHFGRDVQPRENPWAAVDINRKAFSQKKCCAYGVGLGDCKGGVIKAHTVSRGPNLSRIAKDGHVLKFSASISEMNKNGGKLSLNRIGIKDASVFNGFCSKHDRELFSCIENETFAGRPDQCLAMAYRTMSRELYGKNAGSHLRETLRSADKGLKLFEQIMFQHLLDEINEGNEAAQSELKITHDALTSALVDVRPNILSSVIFEFSSPLPFMFAGAWSPFTDFYGEELQKVHADKNLEQVIVSSFASDNNSIICISWKDIDNAPGKVIANQLIELPDEQRASACLQFVTKHVENIFFSEDWFQSLEEYKREFISHLAADGLDPLGMAPSVPIRLDMDFQLPHSVRALTV